MNSSPLAPLFSLLDAAFWPLVLCALIACGTVLCAALFFAHMILSSRDRQEAAQDVSLLSPMLAVELFGPHAARAWLLSVTLDLRLRVHETPRTHPLLDIGRRARRRLISFRADYARDPDAEPLCEALEDCLIAARDLSDPPPPQVLALEERVDALLATLNPL